MILWQNLGVGRVSRCCRATLVYFLSAIIIAIGFVIIIYMSYLRDQRVEDAWSPTMCANEDYVIQEGIDDYFQDDQHQQGIWQCYCFQQFIKTGAEITKIKFGEEVPCQVWLTDYTFSLSIIYGLAFFISLINKVLTEVLYYLSYVERPHTLTQQLEGATSKSWIVMFVNSGLVLLLINADYVRVPLPSNSPVLRGPYRDFSTEWYGPVGATIVMTAIINAVVPFANLVDIFSMSFGRCLDRGCSCDMAKTKKNTQHAYEQVYLGG